MSPVRTYACRVVPRLLGEIEHVPYRPREHESMALPPWACLTCWQPRDPKVEPVRTPWPCGWARIELRKRDVDAVTELCEWAVRGASIDLLIPASDLRWRFFAWLIVPDDTQKLLLLPRQSHGLGAAGQGRPAAPTLGRGRRRR